MSDHYPLRTPGRWAISVMLILFILTGFLVPDSNAVMGAAQSPATVTFVLPDRATAGEFITAQLVVTHVENLAGFQATVSFDSTQLRFGSGPIDKGLTQAGRGFLPLGPVWREDSVVLGAATCAAMNCSDPRPDLALRQTQGVSGDIVLASLTFFVGAPGTHELKLDGVQLVDPQGKPLSIVTSNGAFVAVGQAVSENMRVSLDEDVIASGARRATRPSATGSPRLDLTGNKVVNDADAWDVIEAWFGLQQKGLCIAPEVADRDINSDGCISVADVQMILAHWSESTDSSRRFAPVGEASTATFTVTSSGDGSDSVPGDGACSTSSGVCTLRAALEESNVRGGAEVIRFNIRNANGSCPSLVTIVPNPNTGLLIDDPRHEGITIDGYTQCGAQANTNPVSGNAIIKIEIKGGGGDFGLKIRSGNNVIRGLAIYGWSPAQIQIGGGGPNTIIAGNFIGTNAALSVTSPGEGVRLWFAAYNVIGGTAPQDRNIFGGNDSDAVELTGATYNRIIGNYFSVKQDGRTTRRNGADGIDIEYGSQYNWVGGLNPGERNVISGQGRDGIEISHGSDVQYNHIVGNYLGVDASGVYAVPNGSNGITFEDLTNSNYVYQNVISNNGYNGIRFYALCNSNQIYENKIGVGPNGVTPMPNGTKVVNDGNNGLLLLGGSQHNLIRNNIIANNPGSGVHLIKDPGYLNYSTETHYNTISQNSIYNNGNIGIRLSQYTDGSYPNQGLPRPQIASATSVQVTGTACANCKVEVFTSDKTVQNDPSGDNYGEGKTFIGEGMADGAGNFAINVSGAGAFVTATATDSLGNTSEFARNTPVLNSPPVAADDSASVPEDTPVTISVLSNDSDPEGQALHVAGVGTPANGTASTNGATVTFTPGPNFNGTQSFPYTVSDGGSTDSAQITVMVTPVNDAPIANPDSVGSTPEDTAKSIAVSVLLSNDGDVDGDALSFTGVSPTSAQGGTVTLSGGQVIYTPPANYAGSDTFTYTIGDGNGGGAAGAATLTVTQVNDPPTISDIPDLITSVNTPTSNIGFQIGDLETSAASLSLTASSSNKTLVPNGNIVFGGSGANRTVRITPASNKTGTAMITVTVQDGGGLTVSDTFTLIVSQVPVTGNYRVLIPLILFP